MWFSFWWEELTLFTASRISCLASVVNFLVGIEVVKPVYCQALYITWGSGCTRLGVKNKARK